MALTWDYTTLAAAYADRPPYADPAVDAFLAVAGIEVGHRVCDIGAGTGHLTLPLLQRGLVVDAVEPNKAMRTIGRNRIVADTVEWSGGRGEATGLPGGSYDLVTFGSSFNVMDSARALAEAHRLLVPGGWFACLWNHRDLDSPLQRRIECVIRDRLPGYDLGSRRADQRPIIRSSGLFAESIYLESTQVHVVDRESWINGWRSHATLARQAGAAFEAVVDDLAAVVRSEPTPLYVPYVTRAYVARSVAIR
jgi:SAM-dependent methyltransferase